MAIRKYCVAFYPQSITFCVSKRSKPLNIQNHFENLSYVSSKIGVNALRKSVQINIYW